MGCNAGLGGSPETCCAAKPAIHNVAPAIPCWAKKWRLEEMDIFKTAPIRVLDLVYVQKRVGGKQRLA